MVEKTQVCVKCKREKSIEEIKKTNKTCLRCLSTVELHRARHPDMMWYRCVKYKAKKFKIPFDLEECDFDIPEKCPVFGIPLDGRDREHEPSVDRIIPDKGYVKGNTKIISMKANRLKNNASIEDMLAIVRYLRRNL